jgi:hypothetical protein
MRAWSLILVPLFAAITFILLRPAERGAERPAPSAAATPRRDTPTARPGGDVDRTQRRPPAEKPTLSAARPPANPIVDLQSYSDMERALMEASGSNRGRLAITFEVVKRRVTKLLKSAADFCQAQELENAAANAAAQQAAQELTATQVQVSAWVETGERYIRLSQIVVTPWRGAALTGSFGHCLERYARDNADSPALIAEPPELTFPSFAGSHRMLVGLQTACSAPVRP